MSKLAHEFATVLKRTEFVDRHRAAVVFKRDRRAATVAEISEWPALRSRARLLKAGVRNNLEPLAQRFAAEARARGARVYRATTADQANAIVLEIARSHGALDVVKSKSMTTEECRLNPYLEARGVTVTDTDLGERIVQLFGEPPSHIVTPAIHRSRQEIGELFARHGLCAPGEEDPGRLTGAARRSLRRLFLGADLGLTGANFLVAETGTAVVIENEANSLLGTSLPRVHVVVAGIEKLVERVDDLAVFLTLLAPSSTGQRMTTYATHYTGPAAATSAERESGLADHELHVILLDNGRSDLIGTPAEEALACIRCGACLNVCPVYRRVGGHAYGWVYPGPIGKVLGPGMDEQRAELVRASSLCGACTEVCPVGIDLARHIHEWRRRLREERRLPASLPPGIGYLLRNPDLWHAAMTVARRLGRVSGAFLRATPWLRAWTARGARRLPPPAAESFRDWWRRRPRTEPRPPAPPAVPAYVDPAPDAPPAGPLADPEREPDLGHRFRDALVEAGGESIELSGLPEGCLGTRAAVVRLSALGRSVDQAPFLKEDLDGLPWLVATGRWRVARSGSIWVDFTDLESRGQLLLPEGLVLLVPASPIAADLAGHYARFRSERMPACGTLVTGPSKTADIEQTLVMGAHGPRRLLVLTV